GYSTKTGRLRDVLIVSEVALAVILMVGAGLLLRTLRDLLQENPGFNPTRVVTANIQLPNPNEREKDPYLDIPHRATFNRELLRRMKAIPGVELAAITSALPGTNTNPNAVGGIANEGFAIEDRPDESFQDLRAERIRISPDYFKVLRTSLSATVLEPQIRHEIQSIDPGLPVFGVASMNDVLDRSLASRRFSADLVGGLAGLAVLLASIGIYGLLAYMVGQRSREIGIRMALGARPEDIQRMFLRKGVALAGVGVVAGLIFSASTASVMASLLYGVRPHDPVVFVIVPLLLFAIAAVASYLPARRATQVNPLSAIREA